MAQQMSVLGIDLAKFRPPRQRARRWQGCNSPGHAQRVLAAYGLMAPPFRPRRHRLSACASRQTRSPRFERWAEITGTERAA
jgi:putative transposase